ncbi:hypothetical protein [Lysinibacillus sp. G4S2]|uniref:hypothetical protein n=1 Tax=Lysinibacillus sp. G4S2 TaxID=3055859 RepID=UPI00259FFEC9|nr:hypothetical protein [Lysinibacillus sp. G4S2]MDM5248286.1 hypothetical protein [Lysinibacillus sp. G4S2]
MKRIVGFVTICGLVLVGCSYKESNDIIKQDNSPKFVGDVLAKETEWKESEYFTSGNLNLIGEPQLLGFTNSKEEKIIAGKAGKYAWHFWGESIKTGDFLSVKGTHQLTQKEIELVTNAKLLGPNSGADNHAPTNMTFPKGGMWKLDAYIDGKLFGSVFVKVEN